MDHVPPVLLGRRKRERESAMWSSDVTTQGLKTKQQIQLWMQWSTSQNLKKRTPPSQHASFLLWCAKYSAAHIFRGVFMFVHCSTFVMYCNPAMHFSEYAEHAVGHISDLEDTSCTRAARDGIGRLGTVERRLRRFLSQNRPQQHSEL